MVPGLVPKYGDGVCWRVMVALGAASVAIIATPDVAGLGDIMAAYSVTLRPYRSARFSWLKYVNEAVVSKLFAERPVVVERALSEYLKINLEKHLMSAKEHRKLFYKEA